MKIDYGNGLPAVHNAAASKGGRRHVIVSALEGMELVSVAGHLVTGLFLAIVSMPALSFSVALSNAGLRLICHMQGCGAILALVEIYETVARDDRDLERRKANSLLWKVKDAGYGKQFHCSCALV